MRAIFRTIMAMARRKPPESERLAFWRKRNGWTQADLGTKLGISRDIVARWETGTPIPPYYVEGLKQLGYADADEGAAYERIRITKQAARMLVSILADCSISDEIRTSARMELWKALHLDTDVEFF